MEEEILEKKALRKKMRSLLLKISAAESEELSKKAASLFLNSPLYKEASCVMAFISMSGEIQTEKIIFQALREKKLLLVPRMITENAGMDFYALKDLPLERQTEVNSYGIREPLKELKKYNRDEMPEKTVCLVPGLAFTKDGRRLGRGKGYYDRFLQGFGGIKCGLAFSAQLVKDIPVSERDIKMDYILTENYFFPSAL